MARQKANEELLSPCGTPALTSLDLFDLHFAAAQSRLRPFPYQFKQWTNLFRMRIQISFQYQRQKQHTACLGVTLLTVV
jgi:hypothetical protein